MSTWKEVRGYALSIHPQNDSVSIFLYCGGTLQTESDGPGSWKDTEEYKVEYPPKLAMIALDLLRNEKGLRFDINSEWLYSSRQEAGIGQKSPEKKILTK